MATLREWLTEKNFDWENGIIIWHETEGNSSPGWHSSPISRSEIAKSHPILDLEFDSAYIGPMAPRIFARDEHNIYFPAQYDGSTWLEKVNINPEYYVNNSESETPYPGG